MISIRKYVENLDREKASHCVSENLKEGELGYVTNGEDYFFFTKEVGDIRWVDMDSVLKEHGFERQGRNTYCVLCKDSKLIAEFIDNPTAEPEVGLEMQIICNFNNIPMIEGTLCGGDFYEEDLWVDDFEYIYKRLDLIKQATYKFRSPHTWLGHKIAYGEPGDIRLLFKKLVDDLDLSSQEVVRIFQDALREDKYFDNSDDKNLIDEMCGNCGREVVLYGFARQICPNCDQRILPCSVCDDCAPVGECPLG